MDDETGEPLIQRDDDSEATVLKRLAVPRANRKCWWATTRRWLPAATPAAPKYVKVPGVGSVDGIRDAVFRALGA